MARNVLGVGANPNPKEIQMRIQTLVSVASMACVLGAAACGSTSPNQQGANDPSGASANASVTSAPVTAPIVTAGSTTNQEHNSLNSDPSAQNGAVATNAGATKNFSGSAIAPVATGTTSAQLGATPVQAASASGSMTPMVQGTAKTDVQLTAAVKKQITSKSVKVISNGGKVTLRGSVKTDSEKATAESAARGTAGVTDVDDQIEIKP